MPNQPTPAKSLAELNAKLDAINARIDSLNEKFTNMGTLTSQSITDIRRDVQNLDDQVTKNMVDLGRVSERITLYQALQAGFTTIAAAVAAVVATILGG